MWYIYFIGVLLGLFKIGYDLEKLDDSELLIITLFIVLIWPIALITIGPIVLGQKIGQKLKKRSLSKKQ